jgi:hypothetical protein
MDAETAALIAPTVKQLEDTWGLPLSEYEECCVLAGFSAGMEHALRQMASTLKEKESK